MTPTFIVTGATGFLGQTLLSVIEDSFPNARVVPIHSPRNGGVDLVDPAAAEMLGARICIPNPQNAVLIHAAAIVEWNSPDGLLANAAMALNVASWAKSANVGFSVLVSGVNVYSPLPLPDIDTSCRPSTLYGLGKWTAEQVWRLFLPEQRSAIVRLAGIWGWQRRPTLFWNSLLCVAASGSSLESNPVVYRGQSRRNYISAHEASECLLQVGGNRMAGLFLGAGRDIVDTETFVKALQELPGSKLSIDWEDDGGMDECIYHPSSELMPWLKSFPEVLLSIWASRPDWVLQGL